MSNASFYSRQLIALLALCVMVPAVAFSAEPVNTDQEEVQMIVGDILEIQPSHAFSNPVYSWILTQDRTFIQAGRAEAFRYRFIQPGVYTLIAEVASGDQAQRVRRTFMIDVATRTAQTDTSMPTENNDELVTVEPAPDDEDRVTLITGSRLIRIKPIDPNIRPLALDLDTATDSDGDGSASNDLDSDQTFFQTDATPLYIWFASPLTTQEISVTALDASGDPVNQTIDVMTEEYALEQGFVTSAVQVTIVQQEGLDYLFTARFSRPLPPSTPLLYHWEFGDGTQSLLMNPTHTYAENGSYAVTLRVRNLADGQEVASYEQQLEVTGGAPSEVPPDGNGGEEEPEVPTENSSIPWASIFLYGGIGLATLLLGLLAYAVMNFIRKRGGKLSDKLEEIEQTIVKKDEKADATPHLAISVPNPAAKPVATPPASISKREEELAKPTPQPSPKIDEANSPAWLKSGLKAPTAATPAAPAPAPVPAKPAPAPAAPKPAAPAPTPVAAKPAPTPAAPAAAPTWLQQPAKQTLTTPAPAAPAAVAPKPQPPAAPPVAVTPKPQVAAAPAPVPAPMPKAPVVPVSTPTPQVSPPVTPAPTPVTPPAQPVVTTPVTAPAPTPVTPAPAPKAQTDQPIAIIRAESLNPEKPKNPPEQHDIKPA